MAQDQSAIVTDQLLQRIGKVMGEVVVVVAGITPETGEVLFRVVNMSEVQPHPLASAPAGARQVAGFVFDGTALVYDDRSGERKWLIIAVATSPKDGAGNA